MAVYFHLKFEAPDGRSTAGNAWIATESLNHEADGGTLLTNHCAHIKELEYEVKVMKEELDAVLAKARRKFASAKRSDNIFEPPKSN